MTSPAPPARTLHALQPAPVSCPIAQVLPGALGPHPPLLPSGFPLSRPPRCCRGDSDGLYPIRSHSVLSFSCPLLPSNLPPDSSGRQTRPFLRTFRHRLLCAAVAGNASARAPVLTCATAQTKLWGGDSSSFPCLPPGKNLPCSLKSQLSATSFRTCFNRCPLFHPSIRRRSWEQAPWLLPRAEWRGEPMPSERSPLSAEPAHSPLPGGQVGSSLLKRIRERTFWEGPR